MTAPKTRLVCDRHHMRQELQKLKPTHVAVAYVGRDWATLLGDVEALDEIVLAPVPGTSPAAIDALVKKRGWEKVHFLDHLHSKVYLGASAAMIGSANLSSNALLNGATQLYEMVVVTEDVTIRDHALQEWLRYRAVAQSLYPNEEKKIARLKELKNYEKVLRAAEKGLSVRKAPLLSSFLIGSQAIHLESGQSDDGESSDSDDTNYINTVIGELGHEHQVGDWVLQWECDDNGIPKGREPLTWMRIDEIRLGGAIGDDHYVDQLAERVEPTEAMHPFKLDAIVQKAFKQVMAKSSLRPKSLDHPENKAFSLEKVNELLRELQRRYIELAG